MTPIWCNGQWLEPSDFRVAPTDRGLLHGLGLFETILALDGRPVFLARHLARIRRGCDRLGWIFETTGLEETMRELLVRSGLDHGRSRIRIAITGGSGNIADLSPGNDRLVLIHASAVAEAAPEISANLSPFVRNEHSPLAGLKCASYAENLVALDHARCLGFAETLFLNTTGNLCEAATANLFLVKNGNLLTPSLASGCLPGVTREVVIELAAKMGLSCEEADLPAALIHEADEIFLTSSTRGITGLARIGDRELPPGPLTVKLRLAWDEAIQGEL